MKKSHKKRKGGMLLAGIFGALAGVLGGLLVAPKSGKATREDVVKLAKKGKTVAKEKIAKLKTKKIAKLTK